MSYNKWFQHCSYLFNFTKAEPYPHEMCCAKYHLELIFNASNTTAF